MSLTSNGQALTVSQQLDIRTSLGAVGTADLVGKANTVDLTVGLANKADLSALSTKADVTALALKADASALASKVDSSTLTTALASKVDNTALATALANKADTSALTAKANVIDVSNGLALKADSLALVTGLATKADNSALALKADSSSVSTSLALKADNSTVTTSLALKADAATMTTALALKSNQTDLVAGLATKLEVSKTQILANVSGIQGKLDFSTAVPVTANRSMTPADNGKILQFSTANVFFTVNGGMVAAGSGFSCIWFVTTPFSLVTDTNVKFNYAATNYTIPPGIFKFAAHPTKQDVYTMDMMAAGISVNEILATQTAGYNNITVSNTKTLAASDNRSILSCKGTPNLVINTGLPTGFELEEIRGRFTYSGTAFINDERVLTTASPEAQLLATNDPAVFQLIGTVNSNPNWVEPLTMSDYLSGFSFGSQAGNFLEMVWMPNQCIAAINDADMAVMKEQAGLDHIRIPACSAARTDQYGNIDENFLLQLDAQVDWALDRFDRVILDPLHHHGTWLGSTGSSLYQDSFITAYFTSDQQAALATTMWTTIANRYKNRSLRLSFDLINEPGAATRDASYPPAMTSIDLNKWYQNSVIPAIRATGGNNATRVLWMEPFNNLYKSLPIIQDGNVGISPHFYNPIGYLLNAQGTLNASVLSQVSNDLLEAKKYSDANGLALWIGEIGASQNITSMADRAEFYGFLRKFSRENSIPISFWAWNLNSGFGVYNNQSNLPTPGAPRYLYPGMRQALSSKPYPLPIRSYSAQLPIYTTLNTANSGARLGRIVSVQSYPTTFDATTGRMGFTTDTNGGTNLVLYVFPNIEVLPNDVIAIRAVAGSIQGAGVSVNVNACYWLPNAWYTWSSALGRGKDVSVIGTGGPTVINENQSNFTMPSVMTIPSYAPMGSRLYLGINLRQESVDGFGATTKAGSVIFEVAKITSTPTPVGTKMQINNYTTMVDGYPIIIT